MIQRTKCVCVNYTTSMRRSVDSVTDKTESQAESSRFKLHAAVCCGCCVHIKKTCFRPISSATHHQNHSVLIFHSIAGESTREKIYIQKKRKKKKEKSLWIDGGPKNKNKKKDQNQRNPKQKSLS